MATARLLLRTLVTLLAILAPTRAASWRSADTGNVRNRTSFRVLWGAGQNEPMRSHVISEVGFRRCRRRRRRRCRCRCFAPPSPRPRTPLQVDRDRHRAMCRDSIADANYGT